MMTSLAGLRSKSPLIRQTRERIDGTGLGAMSDKICAMPARIDDALGERMLDFYAAALKSNNAPQISASLRAGRVKTAPSKFFARHNQSTYSYRGERKLAGEQKGRADTKLMPHLEETQCARKLKYCYP
jgi:hypothetical protein